MFWSPIYIISRFLLRLVFKNVNVKFVYSLLKTTLTLIRNVGILPTVYIMRSLLLLINRSPRGLTLKRTRRLLSGIISTNETAILREFIIENLNVINILKKKWN